MKKSPTPFFDAVEHYIAQQIVGFHVPGHQQGQGAPDYFRDFLKKHTLAADLTQVEGIDDLHRPQRECLEAQELAAQAFGAEATYFLINGSTGGNQAMMMSALRPGQTVLIPRNAHRSTWGAAILADVQPVFYDCPWDPVVGVTQAADLDTVATALQRHPEARALWITSPTYYGACPDLESLVGWAHQKNLVVLVDEAWGPHFAFHPRLPNTALQAGADLVVQSTHKLLSGLSQASMLHVQGSRVDRVRLQQVLQILQSSSPSCLLLASLDVARQQMVDQGPALWSQVLQLAERARQEICAIDGVHCYGPEIVGRPGVHSLDLSRLIIGLTQLACSGYQAEKFLRQKHGIQVELSDRYNLLALVTLGHQESHLNRLIEGLQDLARSFPTTPLNQAKVAAQFQPLQKMSPRQAFNSPCESVQLAGAEGKISAEMICPYPPGIPLVYPGEILDAHLIAHLQSELAAGVTLQGSWDPQLKTIRVIKG